MTAAAKQIMEVSHAIAEAVKMMKPAVIAAYPITPQTHIVERLSDFVANGELKSRYINVESEFSALSACLGAEATGVRSYTATSSQGLALMFEVLFIVSGMRMPVGMTVVNRALSAPINIWCFTKDAKVLMADLTYKSISKVKKGDLILGKDSKGNLRFTKVKRTFTRVTNNLIKLKTNKFDLVCTPEHKFYYWPNHTHWIKAFYLKGKNIHYFGYEHKLNDEFKRGWLAGISDGDGCFYTQGNRYHFRLKVKDKEIVDTFVQWANHFKFPLRKVNYLEKEGYFIAIITLTSKTKDFKEFLNKKTSIDFCRGYLAGMYDAEGSGPFKVKQAVIYNNDQDIIKKVSSCLNLLDIKFRKYVDKRDMNYHIKINQVPEFFIMCRPMLERKRKNLLRMTLKSVKSRLKIIDIIPIKKSMKVYNLETETNNYIVNGFLVHNCDHQDSMSVRDSGWIQVYAETAQECFDLTIMQYKISEDPRVLLPSMVCLDGFTLSHVYEPADIPPQKKISDFLPEYRPYHAILDPKQPLTLGPIGFPSHFMELRYTQQKAIENSLEVISKVYKEFSEKFPVTIKNSRPRRYGHVEQYKMKDAKIAFIALGSVCGTLKFMIDKLREKGAKVGLLKIRTYRPFPRDAITKALKGVKKLAVLEKAISPGANGPIFEEIRSAFYELKEKPEEIRNFIIGLGGRDVTPENIQKIYDLMKSEKGKLQEWIF